jgi:hypothetical protein
MQCPPGPRNAMFQLGVLYEVDDNNRLARTHRRSVERQAAQLQAEAEEDQWIEETANPELPESIAEDLQAEYQRHVDFAAAQLAADARRADEVSDAAIAAAEPP